MNDQVRTSVAATCTTQLRGVNQEWDDQTERSDDSEARGGGCTLLPFLNLLQHFVCHAVVGKSLENPVEDPFRLSGLPRVVEEDRVIR